MQPCRMVVVLCVLFGLHFSAGQPPVAVSDLSAPQSSGAPLAFVLRVNPVWADKVNEVLARVSLPLEIRIPTSQTPEKYLARLCGGYSTPHKVVGTSAEGLTIVLATPCVLMRQNVQVKATEGDTLEGLAVRNGLPAAEGPRLKVMSRGDDPARTIAPADLKTGDVVVLPRLPGWTNIQLNPSVAADRAALVAALASRLGCGEKDAEICLTQRNVMVLNRGTGRDHNPIEFDPAVEVTRRILGGLSAITGTRGAIEGVPDLPRAPLAAPVDHPQAHTPVDPEQWPYDVRLLVAILKDSAGHIRTPAAIGIADGGLANASGGPLRAEVFQIGTDKPGEGDDNDNNYDDDHFGAGVPRVSEIRGTGDLGLCKAQQPPFAQWSEPQRKRASHGAIVGAVAAALPLRKEPAVASVLPNLVFFRMLRSACLETDETGIAEGDMVDAFEYLRTRATIVNISYEVSGRAGRDFATVIKQVLIHRNVLLVLPAGNDTVSNLDRTEDCPACLGNRNEHLGGAAARRTLVVGAATRQLRRASFSSFGKETVGIFAPAEPLDAVDLADRVVPAHEAATSLAAPLVALAAALIESIGTLNKPWDLKDRLMASTWPLDDPPSAPDETHVGVLDLVKASAVRHHTVEVKEPDRDGGSVRRTYVGKLVTPFTDLKLCAGRGFKEGGVHAIRLGDPSDTGDRRVLVYYKNKEDGRGRRLIEEVPTPCRSEGDLRIDTLLHGVKTFPLNRVTHLMLPWQ